MTPTALALLATVHANPGDTTALMVYADALEESGDEVGAQIQRSIAEPHNDGHRLALAAALERTAGEEKCELCKTSNSKGQIYTGMDGMKWIPCPKCKGGRVSDGRKEWSEFIRVQCELAGIPEFLRLEDFSMQVIKERDAVVGRLERNTRIEEKMRQAYPEAHKRLVSAEERQTLLRRRERELWPAVRGRFEGYGVEPCYQTGLMVHQPPDGEIIQRSTVLIQRGLPSVVRCTLAEWMGGEECENCGGFGEFRRRHGHDGPEGPCPDCGGKWNSGPHTDHDDYWDCGTGRTPGIGPRLAQAWPIERVEVTDRKAFLTLTAKYTWWRASGWIASHDEDSNLPDLIFGTIADLYPESSMLSDSSLRDQHLAFDTESAARAALSDAAIEWARGRLSRI